MQLFDSYVFLIQGVGGGLPTLEIEERDGFE